MDQSAHHPERDHDSTHDTDETTEGPVTDHTEELTRADATQQLPLTDEPADARPETGTETVGSTPAETWPPKVPPRPSGPHAPAILLGIVCLAVAAIVLAQELGDLSVDWGDVGPLGFVAVGAVLVVLGAVGLVSSNRRSHRS